MKQKTTTKPRGSRNKKQQQNNDDNIPVKKVIAISSGVLLLIVSVFMFLSFSSFIFNGGEDIEHFVKDGSIDTSGLFNGGKVNNICGAIGFLTAHTFVNGLFGIAAYLIAAYFFMMGLRIINVNHANPFKWFLIFAIATIFISFTADVIAPDSVSSVRFGGDHGRMLHKKIQDVIGPVGVWAIIIICLVAIIFYYFRSLPQKIVNALHTDSIKDYCQKVADKLHGGAEETPSDATASTNSNALQPDPVTYTDPQSAVIVFDKDSDEIMKADGDDNFELLLEDEESHHERKESNESASEDVELLIEDVQETAKGNGEPQRGSIDTPYDPKLDLEYYKYPPLSLLKSQEESNPYVDIKEQNENKNRIIHILRSFGVEISSIKATIGPTITLYEITPAEGVRITKIRNLEDDIALSLAAEGIRIIAPIPGKGTIGIEVPNKKKCIVSMESVLNSKTYQETTMDLPCAIGKTITNEVFMVDLAKAPHMLVAGATGMGKSVGLNAIVTSLLYKKHPTELKIVMVDPKKVEFGIYEPIANQFLAKLEDEEEPIITDNDRVVKTLKALCKLMDDRYALLKKANVRHIKEYNELFKQRKLNPNEGHMFMPYFVVVIDEFGDLIMTAGKEVELPICRIAQLARAIGIHMIIATQRPTTNIITGTIKANFPARIAFRVTSGIDSKIILDRPGANQLIGKGDMLYLQAADPVRVQCAFVDTPEVKQLAKYISEQQQFPEMTYLPEPPSEDGGDEGGKDVDMNHLDPMFGEVARMIVAQNSGSTSLIQRKFSIGYNRAGRLMDQLEKAGIVGPQQGSKPRDVLISDLVTLDNLLATYGIH